MTSKQRSYLKSLAVNLDTIFQIGKTGVSEETIYQLGNALEARELIKIKVLESAPESAKEISLQLENELLCDVVQVIGCKIVLFRVSSVEKNRKIDLKNV